MRRVVKNLAANARDTLGQKDPLKEGRETHSNILACRIPWTEEPGGVHGVTKSQI